MDVITPGEEVWVRGTIDSITINKEGNAKYFVRIPHFSGKQEFAQGVYVGRTDMLYDPNQIYDAATSE